MKPVPVFLLGVRVSIACCIAAGSLFLVAAQSAHGLLLDIRHSAMHATITYAVLLVTLIVTSRVRKMDVAFIVTGVFSLFEIAFWLFQAKATVPDHSLANWLADLAGITAATLPLYVETARRGNRQRRRTSDYIAQARNFTTRVPR